MQTRHAHIAFEFCILNFALPHLYGNISSSLGLSASDTCSVPRIWRLDLVVLLVRMWRLNAFARMILPVPVFLKRFAAPRCVFSFGMLSIRRVRRDPPSTILLSPVPLRLPARVSAAICVRHAGSG